MTENIFKIAHRLENDRNILASTQSSGLKD